jgi:hypothetical protein
MISRSMIPIIPGNPPILCQYDEKAVKSHLETLELEDAQRFLDLTYGIGGV